MRRASAQEWMTRASLESLIQLIQLGEDPHLDNRIDAQIGARPMRRLSGYFDVKPDEAFVRDAEIQPCRLRDHRGVGVPSLHNALRPKAGIFLVDHRRHENVATQSLLCGGSARQQYCGSPPFMS